MSIDYEEAVRRLTRSGEDMGRVGIREVDTDWWHVYIKQCHGPDIVHEGEGQTRRAAFCKLYGKLRRAAIALLSDEFDFEGEP